MVVMHAGELLHAARRNAIAMADSAWRYRRCRRRTSWWLTQRHRHAGNDAENMREGGLISAHDYRAAARRAGRVACGGEIETRFAWAAADFGRAKEIPHLMLQCDPLKDGINIDPGVFLQQAIWSNNYEGFDAWLEELPKHLMKTFWGTVQMYDGIRTQRC